MPRSCFMLLWGERRDVQLLDVVMQGATQISLAVSSQFLFCSSVSLEQHGVRWDSLKRPPCLPPPHDLCTHNIFTVPYRSSYFSLTLIIEMRHLARLNGGPVVARWNDGSP